MTCRYTHTHTHTHTQLHNLTLVQANMLAIVTFLRKKKLLLGLVNSWYFSKSACIDTERVILGKTGGGVGAGGIP